MYYDASKTQPVARLAGLLADLRSHIYFPVVYFIGHFPECRYISNVLHAK
jgi:hypothetical protein